MAASQQTPICISVPSFAGGNSSATTISLGSPVVIGNLIIVAYSTNNVTRTVTGVTDAGGTTYAALRAMDSSAAGRTQIWWGIASATNAGNTVVVTLSGAHSDATNVTVASFSGCASDQSGAQSNGNNETGTQNFTSNSVTPPNATGVLFAARHGSSGNYVPDPDFTNIAGTASNFGFGYRVDSGDAQAYTYTADANETTATQINAFAGAGGTPAPSISDINGDDEVELDSVNNVLAGSNFDLATVQIEQDSEVTVVPFDNADADSADVDAPAVGTAPRFKIAAATLRVINTDDQEDTLAITITAPADTDYVDLGTPTATYPRITAIPDLASGDQLQWGNVQGGSIGDVIVYDNASIAWAESVTAFDVRAFDDVAKEWSSWVTQTIEAAVWSATAYVRGIAVDADGVVGTIFLSDVTPVPGSAVFINGVALHADGRMYICAWPGSGIVAYVNGWAVRPDGAVCTITGGLAAARMAGVALTSRGEVLITTSNPELIYGGFGLREDGTLCVLEAS